MKIVAYMTVKDEVDRYLERCLTDLLRTVDAVAVYDDQSSDGSAELARDLGAVVAQRPTGVSSFMRHEGRFRQAAWDFTARALGLQNGDFIFAVDADEWIGHPTKDPKAALREACERAPRSCTSILVQKHEVFAFDDDGTPLVRTDGYWGNIVGHRLCRWMPGGVFADKVMGSGCEPTYAGNRPHSNNNGIYLLHYGYARQEDQQLKFDRYSTLMDHGHSDRHIQSIIARPSLQRFGLPFPQGVH